MRTPEQIHAAVDRLKAARPELAELLDAFGPVLVARAALAGAIRPASSKAEALGRTTRDQFLQGKPLCEPVDLTPSSAELADSLRALAPVLTGGFPGLREDLARLTEAVAAVAVDLRALATGEAAARAAAERLELDPDRLEFTLRQIARPGVEAAARQVAEENDLTGWDRGGCPVCGSAPELGYLAGQEGKRYLACGFCGHEWRFARARCPACDAAGTADDSAQLKRFTVEDRESEQADACEVCARYLLTVDARVSGQTDADALVPQVAGLGLMHLDMLLQEQGFEPVAAQGRDPARRP